MTIDINVLQVFQRRWHC